MEVRPEGEKGRERLGVVVDVCEAGREDGAGGVELLLARGAGGGDGLRVVGHRFGRVRWVLAPRGACAPVEAQAGRGRGRTTRPPVAAVGSPASWSGAEESGRDAARGLGLLPGDPRAGAVGLEDAAVRGDAHDDLGHERAVVPLGCLGADEGGEHAQREV